MYDHRGVFVWNFFWIDFWLLGFIRDSFWNVVRWTLWHDFHRYLISFLRCRLVLLLMPRLIEFLKINVLLFNEWIVKKGSFVTNVRPQKPRKSWCGARKLSWTKIFWIWILNVIWRVWAINVTIRQKNHWLWKFVAM